MKLNFSKSVGRSWAKALPLLAGLLLSPLVAMATDSGYTNTSAIIYAPNYIGNTVPSIQVDATTFVNLGTWEIYTYDKYKTANTLNYFNEGSMWGTVGWDFAFHPSTTGVRGMSASFFNDATIEAADSYIRNPEVTGTNFFLVSYLWVSATNIVNNGTLIGDSGGEIRLTGSNVDLFYSTLEINGFTRGAGSEARGTNFMAPTGVYDEYWGQTNTFPSTVGGGPYTINTLNIWDGAVAMSPVFYVTYLSLNGLCGVSDSPAQIGFGASLADSISMTNLLTGMTNIVSTNSTGLLFVTNTLPIQVFRQAVFVAISDTNITAANWFLDTLNPTNLFRRAMVGLRSAFGDTLYLEDELATTTNRGLVLNITDNPPGSNPQTPCTDPTYRPANYSLEGSDTDNELGSPGVGPPATNFLYDISFTNVVVPATYAGYSAYIDDLIRHSTTTDLTNLPGRIVIDATNLDLSWTTINNPGAEVTVHSGNLIDSTGAVVSCRNLSYTLGSAVGNLNVTNLASSSFIPGLIHGTMDAFSALWTNGYFVVITNYAQVITNWSEPVTNIVCDSGTPPVCVTNIGTTNYTATNWVYAPITNTTEMDFYVLILDASGLSTTEPVLVQDLILHSTNMLASDSMNVVHTLLFDGRSLTLQGNLTLSSNLQSWSYVNAPTLRYFTNNGALSIPQNAHFGDDGPTNYAAFVNNGTITSGNGSVTINSDYFQGGGNISAPGGFSVTTSTGKVENASITSSQQSVGFYADILKLNNSTITAGRQLNFSVTHSLYDMGGSSGNTLTCNHGFNLSLKPVTGDLLGTTIQSMAAGNVIVSNVWAATNLGPSLAGFSNNVAIGRLVLIHSGTNPPLPSFRFSGTGVSNALYVDELDLSQLSTNYSNMLQFNPNIVIYYAAATNNYTPPQAGGVDQEWEEYLNGQFGGHLRWVTNFVGPNSSVAVLINGQTYMVNRALRYSEIIDSNGNGIPNGSDPNPFSVPPLGSTPVSSVMLEVSLMQQSPTGQSSPMAMAQVSQSSSAVVAISWTPSPNTVYSLQYSTNLGIWYPLLSYTNNATTNQVTVLDTNASLASRFYRVHP